MPNCATCLSRQLSSNRTLARKIIISNSGPGDSFQRRELKLLVLLDGGLPTITLPKQTVTLTVALPEPTVTLPARPRRQQRG